MESTFISQIRKNIFPLTLLSFTIFDILSGMAIYYDIGIHSVFIIIKFFLLILLVLSLLDKRQIGWIIMLFIFFIFITFLHNHSFHNILYYFYDIKAYILLISLLIFTFSGIKYLETYKESVKMQSIIFILIWGLYSANIILGLCGFGFTQYITGGGIKGFFISGNEFSISYVLITYLSSLQLNKNNKKVLILLLIASTIFSFYIGMKVAVLGTILVVLNFIYVNKGNFVNSLSKKNKIQLLSLFIIIFFFGFIILLRQSFFHRIDFLYRRDGLMGAIFSGREQFALQGFKLYTIDFIMKEKIFGIGILREELLLGNLVNTHHKIIELDLLDSILSLGILPTILIYFYWIKYIFKLSRLHSGHFFIQIMLFIISLFAGHVLFAHILIPYWAYIFALTLKRSVKHLSISHIGAATPGGIREYMLATARHQKKAGIRASIINTHNNKLFKIILNFPIIVIKLFIQTFNSTIQNQSLIFQYHMAAKGSFIRKFILATIFWPFTTKQILHIHGGKVPYFFRNILRIKGMALLLNFFFKLFSSVILVSESLKNELISVLDERHINVDYSQWHVLPNAIELPDKLPTPKIYKNGAQLKLLFVGRFSEEKNLPALLEIGKLIKQRKLNATITLVGDGKFFSWIEKTIKEYRLEKIVLLAGWIEHEQIDILYRKYHYFILPSKFESFGLVVLDAYKNGLPVLSSRAGGLKDIVQERKTGFLFEDDDITGFANKIEFIINNPQIIKVQQKNVQRYVKEFSYDKHITKLVKIINS